MILLKEISLRRRSPFNKVNSQLNLVVASEPRCKSSRQIREADSIKVDVPDSKAKN